MTFSLSAKCSNRAELHPHIDSEYVLVLRDLYGCRGLWQRGGVGHRVEHGCRIYAVAGVHWVRSRVNGHCWSRTGDLNPETCALRVRRSAN